MGCNFQIDAKGVENLHMTMESKIFEKTQISKYTFAFIFI
jgi:hypothetical protein